MARKKNYLNNRDLLKEIHKSKISYCSYRDKTIDTDYDLILESVEEIFGEQNIQVGKDDDGEPIMDMVPTITIAKFAKAKRLAKIAYDSAVAAGEKVKQAQFAIDPESYADEDLVFRISTFEHIPLAPAKAVKTKVSKRKKKVTSPLIIDLDDEVKDDKPKKIKYVKIKFPPFFHYRLNDGKAVIVAKSHWQGDLEGGEFNTEHGSMTDKLAMMFMKLCERYSTKANWRGYSYNDEMRGQALLQLAHAGLRFNEARSDNPFAYYTTIVGNAFTRIFNLEKLNQKIRDDILESNDLTPSYSRQNENDTERMKKLEKMYNGAMVTADMSEADWWNGRTRTLSKTKSQ